VSKSSVRSEKKEMRLMRVDCEICGEFHHLISDHAGVYICARCRRDIVSLDIHD